MALISLCLLHACMQKEEPENLYGVVEFVVRPTKYNGQDVKTRATSVADFEDKIHNCYFLLFNNAGNRTFISNDLGNTLATQRFNKQQLAGSLDAYTNSTACFIANVPKSVVEGITTLSQLNSVVLDITYSSVDVFDIGNNKNSSFVVPEFDLDDNSTTESIQCIPMLGMNTCNLKTTDLFQISLKRVFAKISVNIRVTQNLSSFDLLAAHLFNLPTKVKLTEPANPASYESEWVKDASAFVVSQIEGPIDDDDISTGALGAGNSSYEFYFYSPEYFLQPRASSTANYGNEKYKPLMYDNSSDNPKYPTYIKLFGSYKDASISGSSIEADVKYDLYLGENASTSFTLRRNMHYTNNITINGITNSVDGTGETLDCRVEITTHNMAEIYGQTANCYIIGKTGTYIYPACKGVFKGGLENIPESLLCSNSEGKTLKLEILKNDNTSNKITNLAFNPESKEFSFDLTEMDGGTGLIGSNDGNIILGLTYMENGVKKIEWSWHIWVVNGAFWGTDAFEMTTQTYPNSYQMMDRNLGAKPTAGQKNTAGVVTGFYYKYGHKEPYIDGAYCGGGESSSYTWSGEEKAKTDPCPPGYRVPVSDVWKKANTTDPDPTKEHYSNWTTGDAFKFWGDHYYPYSGYVDANGKIQSQGYSRPDTTSNFSCEIPKTTSTYNSITYLNYNPPLKFTNVKYSKYDINNLGMAVGQDQEFRYSYVEKGTNIISCKLQVGTWSQSGSWYNRKYNAQYNSAVQTLTGAQLKSLNESYYNRLVAVINGNDGSNLDNILDGLFVDPEAAYEIRDIASTSYGYQVRCVKE